MGILATVVILTILISAQCSLYEATLLSTRVSALEATQRQAASRRLADRMIGMKRKVAVPIAAILILNTFANTAGATIAGMYANTLFGPRWVVLFSVLLTLTILFVAEIIPKTLGALHWRTIWPFIVRPLAAITYLTYPLIAVTEKVTDWLTPGRPGPMVTEEEILAFIRLGAKGGEISRWEERVVHNLLQLEEIPVTDVMTPRSVVFSIDDGAAVSAALAEAGAAGFTRVPVYHGDKENIVGYVILSQLAAASVSDEGDPPITDMVMPIAHVDEDDQCLAMLMKFLRSRTHIAVVADPYGGVAGLVTLEDLLESLLGTEIVDEQDIEVDMRKAARRKRKERREAASEDEAE